jgi:transposase-like protein/transposase
VIRLTGAEKHDLRQIKRQRTTQAGWVERAKIILLADRGRTTIEETALRLGCGRDKVLFWRRRFLEGHAAKLPVAERLHDRPRSGRPRVFSSAEREAVALSTLAHYQAPTPRPPASGVATVGAPPGTVLRASGLVVCTSRDLAEELSRPDVGFSISHSTIVRIWHERDLKPWRWQRWLHSPDPELVSKSRAICRLYRHPPTDGTLLCLDEKPGIQILERWGLDQSCWPGRVARHAFEYVRHGTLDLFAAFAVQTGWVYGRCYEHHRAIELAEFLDYLDRVLPVSECGVLHLISDNLKTRTAPETLQWMAEHPGRVVWHFLPTHASWLNQVEIWFSVLSRKSLKGGSWRSYAELQSHILTFIRTYNRRWAHPYNWKYKGLPLAA